MTFEKHLKRVGKLLHKKIPYSSFYNILLMWYFIASKTHFF